MFVLEEYVNHTPPLFAYSLYLAPLEVILAFDSICNVTSLSFDDNGDNDDNFELDLNVLLRLLIKKIAQKQKGFIRHVSATPDNTLTMINEHCA